MARTYREIVDQAMKLPPRERADLADALWTSVDTPESVAAAWDEEIQRRIGQLDFGEIQSMPLEEVIAGLRAKLR